MDIHIQGDATAGEDAPSHLGMARLYRQKGVGYSLVLLTSCDEMNLGFEKLGDIVPVGQPPWIGGL